MSKILVFLKSALTSKEKMEISKIFNKSLTEVNTAIESSIPIDESVLFMNDYPEKADRLNKLIDTVYKDNLRFFEVEDDFKFEDVKKILDLEISADILSNILESADDYE